jgi:hypothetical protein
MREMIASLVESGLDPSVVADRVVESVKANRFYVLPHPEVADLAVARARRIADNARPTFGAS